MFVRSAYNYDTMAVSDETGLKCEDESKAQQHQRDEADINTIVRRFGLTGELPSNVRVPQYGDFSEVSDYQTALNVVNAANIAFMRMPADIRSRFNNDPALFVDFCSNPANQEEMKEIGVDTTPAGAAPTGTPGGTQTATPQAPATGGATAP